MGAQVVDKRYQVNFRDMLPTHFTGGVGFVCEADEDHMASAFLHTLDLLGIEGSVFDLSKDDFHDSILAAGERILLIRPMHFTNQQRQMFWEKTDPLYDVSDRSVFPARAALRIYEAKRELAYFLKINRIPHPETHVFYNMEEALSFASTCKMPQVFKTNTGAGATGVEILRDRHELTRLIRDIFLRHYVKRSLSDYRDIDYGHVILQEFISPVREFRVIKIGSSWFGHEKMPSEKSELMSGSGVNAWTPPPFDLLDFCDALAKRFDFTTMCFDIFKSGDGPYLVNELQTWFGSYDNSQMYLDGVPGRYVRVGTSWKFEVGYFNQFRSLPLIIVSALEALQNGGDDEDRICKAGLST